MRRVLILGGYGAFGGRLARLLAAETGLTLIIAGRSGVKAQTFCAAWTGRATVLPQAVDREHDIEQQLKEIAPDIVIDASGPFQHYGDPYSVVRAALTLRIPYLDFADGSEFVDGIARFDQAAKGAGIFILSGVSSFPVLTAAVVRKLTRDITHLDTVSAGIAPSPYAGVGLSVIHAIAGYAGHPIRMPDGSIRTALVDTRYYTIAPPGRLPLPPTLFSLVDVPDLKALPALWPSISTVWIGAGPVPRVLHRALNVVGLMVRARLLPSAASLAPLMHSVIKVMRWGEHRGGMFVSVTGTGRDGAAIERSWHLVAEGDDGPYIPSMACEAIIRRWLNNDAPTAGARAATREIEVDDYERLFARHRIFVGVREPMRPGAPLYRRMLGTAYDLLPLPLRTMHDISRNINATGIATVERGSGLFARIVGAMFRFPAAGNNVAVTVSFEIRDQTEIWRRHFAGTTFSSAQWLGHGRFAGLLCERFGPLTFGLALLVEVDRLKFVVRRWSIFGICLPLALAPQGDSYEYAKDDRFYFNVEIALPRFGRIVRYHGWLLRNT